MDETIDELFPTMPDAVRAILAEVRRVVRDAIPGAIETLYHGALGYGPNGSGSDRILYIAPQNGYVNLGFFLRRRRTRSYRACSKAPASACAMSRSEPSSPRKTRRSSA